jgi:hypothetical protein
MRSKVRVAFLGIGISWDVAGNVPVGCLRAPRDLLDLPSSLRLCAPNALKVVCRVRRVYNR